MTGMLVTERGLLFNGEEVRATLDGVKTQFRRVVKPQPEWNGARWVWPIPKRAQQPRCSTICVSASREWHEYMPPGCCPYGQPGDRLWVRETFALRLAHEFRGELIPGIPFFQPRSDRYQQAIYRADQLAIDGDIHWRPSIHMPRWASRITLEVTGVRVERVQEITEEDANAEGVTPAEVWANTITGAQSDKHRRAFRQLWDSINAKRGYSWKSNPWVWIVEYRRVES